jgi:hypothetical protein
MKLGYKGSVSLPLDVVRRCDQLAARDYAAAAAAEFSTEEVRDIIIPSFLERANLFSLIGAPLRTESRGSKMYATCGVDTHVDDMDGLSVCLVLHADGFTFVQGRNRLRLKAGDWFIFDDRLPHEVKDSKKSTTLLVLTHPIEERSS